MAILLYEEILQGCFLHRFFLLHIALGNFMRQQVFVSMFQSHSTNFHERTKQPDYQKMYFGEETRHIENVTKMKQFWLGKKHGTHRPSFFHTPHQFFMKTT